MCMGCAVALDALLDAIAPEATDTLVFLGDLVDQGPQTREVIERIIELTSRCHVVIIEGNHEEMMFAAHESVGALRYRENCGEGSRSTRITSAARLPTCPQSIGSYSPKAARFSKPTTSSSPTPTICPTSRWSCSRGTSCAWVVLEPAEMRPHLSGKTVFVGHTEQRDGEVLDLGFVVCIDTSCWRYGWLTAIDVRTRETWQASKWGLCASLARPATASGSRTYSVRSGCPERIRSFGEAPISV